MSSAGHPVDQCLSAESGNGLLAGMAYVGPVADVPSVLAQLGGDVEEIFADAGVDLSLCEHRHNQISALAVERLLLLCADRTMCPHFGLLVGQPANLASLDTRSGAGRVECHPVSGVPRGVPCQSF